MVWLIEPLVTRSEGNRNVRRTLSFFMQWTQSRADQDKAARKKNVSRSCSSILQREEDRVILQVSVLQVSAGHVACPAWVSFESCGYVVLCQAD
ncbi:hypothetical protein AVEN_18200-1 [Araneus ventricosus]|uniref:Uncharacterized protein n=1 Tax=Araneus ventricosus TaxID=182803 RepID=A0A4Y2AKD1_ARAVE|nr:hypothetical protein AVEN_18200-1 [Araneus ventricosus]